MKDPRKFQIFICGRSHGFVLLVSAFSYFMIITKPICLLFRSVLEKHTESLLKAAKLGDLKMVSKRPQMVFHKRKLNIERALMLTFQGAVGCTTYYLYLLEQ